MDLFSMSNSFDDFTFNLKRDLVFFDIESTGLNVMKDRIIQIAFVKLKVGGGPPEELELLVNPGVPISEEAMAVHGITPQDVRNKPLFREVARDIFNFIGNADMAGYNSDRFDLPMLMEEFNRCGIDFDIDGRRMIDVQKIFYKMEPRTLKAAYKFYCDQKLTNAHDALADVRATVDVLKGQIIKYRNTDFESNEGEIIENPVRNDIQSINNFLTDKHVVDFTQRLRRTSEGKIIFNFGKYANQEVREVFRADRNYYHWIMQKDFSSQVKKIVSGIIEDIDKSGSV